MRWRRHPPTFLWPSVNFFSFSNSADPLSPRRPMSLPCRVLTAAAVDSSLSGPWTPTLDACLLRVAKQAKFDFDTVSKGLVTVVEKGVVPLPADVPTDAVVAALTPAACRIRFAALQKKPAAAATPVRALGGRWTVEGGEWEQHIFRLAGHCRRLVRTRGRSETSWRCIY